MPWEPRRCPDRVRRSFDNRPAPPANRRARTEAAAALRQPRGTLRSQPSKQARSLAHRRRARLRLQPLLARRRLSALPDAAGVPVSPARASALPRRCNALPPQAVRTATRPRRRSARAYLERAQRSRAFRSERARRRRAAASESRETSDARYARRAAPSGATNRAVALAFARSPLRADRSRRLM